MKTYFTHGQAYEVIKAAVGADSIKLLGNGSSDIPASQVRGRADAAYLVTLLMELTGQKAE